jgi:hypothetical protein
MGYDDRGVVSRKEADSAGAGWLRKASASISNTVLREGASVAARQGLRVHRSAALVVFVIVTRLRETD